jgi:hypothetical protein
LLQPLDVPLLALHQPCLRNQQGAQLAKLLPQL